MRNIVLWLAIGCCIWLSACKKELSVEAAPPIITLQFSNVAGSTPLVLNTGTYTDFDAESYSVTAFKYYISNIQLISLNGTFQSVPGIYHLVDASDSASQSLSFIASADSVIALSFLIGVDSAQDVSKSQPGDLSPSKGMYWNDTAGYIMAELQGTSSASTGAGGLFQYQIGGFKGSYNVLRTATLALPGAPFTLLPEKADTLLVSISANVNAWFQGQHILTIAQNPSCTAPGVLASEFADNYSMMFSVTNAQIK